MRAIFLILLIVILIGGGFYLSKITDKFTNFDNLFGKIYEQVDKNIPPINDLNVIEYNNYLINEVNI